MKIVDVADVQTPDWVKFLESLDDESFIDKVGVAMSESTDSLEKVVPVVDRIDSLLLPLLSRGAFSSLSVLLDVLKGLLRRSQQRAAFNSISELVAILDAPDWGVVYRSLEILHLLARSSDMMRTGRLQKTPGLPEKLYVISMGNYLNNPAPCPLHQVVTGCEPFRFQYLSGDSLVAGSEGIPEDLSYTLLNRERSNAVLADEASRQQMLAAQLLAVACLTHLFAGASQFQHFRATLPEMWLVPSLPELLRLPVGAELHIQVLNLLAAVSLTQEKNQRGQALPPTPLLEAVYGLMEINNEAGLLQRLLRQVCAQDTSEVPSAADRHFAEALLNLAAIATSNRPRGEVAHVPGMTAALLTVFDARQLDPSNMEHSAELLCTLVSQSVDAFKEMHGAERMLTFTLDLLRGEAPLKPTRSCLRLLGICLDKWDSPGRSSLPRVYMDSELPALLKQLFERGRFELIDSCAVLLNKMIGQNGDLVGELTKNLTISTLFDAFDRLKTASPKLISATVRLLCTIALHADGARYIPLYNIVTHLLQAVGSLSNQALSNEEVRAIGEGLSELLSLVPAIKDKMVNGAMNLLKALPHNLQSATQLSNIAKTFGVLFSNSQDLTRTFIEKDGLELFLAVFRIPTLPLSFNENHLTIIFLKSIPPTLMSAVLGKVLAAILTALSTLEATAGGLKTLEHFAHVEARQPLLQSLAAIDAYVDMVRFIVQNANPVKNHLIEFSRVLGQLADYSRVLVAEQARISGLSQPSEKLTSEFKVKINVKEVENPDLKSFEEKLLLSSQANVTKLLSFVAKIPGARSRSSVPEEVGLKLSKLMGEILLNTTRRLGVEGLEKPRAFALCLSLSEMSKICFSEQGASAAVMHSYLELGGLDAFGAFVDGLKEVSGQMQRQGELDEGFVNFLQILWNLSGKFLEGLVSCKFAETPLIKSLGLATCKEVARALKQGVLEQVRRLHFLECGLFSNNFASSVLEIVKQLTDLSDEHFVDPQAVARVSEMGFPEYVARQAVRNVGAPSVELATEWILSHPEVYEFVPEEEPPAMDLSNTHQALINAIPAVPELHAGLSDLLVKICARPDAPTADVGLMLLSLVGSLAAELLLQPGLQEITSCMSTLDPVKVAPNLEQLRSALHVLHAVSSKVSDVFEIIKDNGFADHACCFLQARPTSFDWVGPLFSLLDSLVRLAGEGSDELLQTLAEFLKFNSAQETSLLGPSALLPLAQLLESLTFAPSGATQFLASEALLPLLLINSQKSLSKQLPPAYAKLLRQLVEDETVLQAVFELKLLHALQEPRPLERFLKDFAPLAARAEEVFSRALKNATLVYRQDSALMVKPREDRQIVTPNNSQVVCVVANALAAAFEDKTQSLFAPEDLTRFLAELIQEYPFLIKTLLEHSVSVRGETYPFWRFLLRQLLPFRYTFKLQGYQITHASSSGDITNEAYQNWIKACCRLLKAMIFKQTGGTQNPLQDNSAVVKARKLMVRELEEILTDHVALDSPEDVCIARTIAIVIMQLLREPSKDPFATNNPVELAKLLTGERTVSLLETLTKNVNLHSKKANVFLNLLLSPLELLIQYEINFTLHSSKQCEAIEQKDSEHSGSSSEDSADEEIVLANRNTEAYWGDDPEEPRHHHPYRPPHPYIERFMPDMMQDEVNIRNIFDFRPQIPRDFDESYYMLQMLNMESRPDIIQYLMQHRHPQREEPVEPARHQPADYSFDNLIIEFAENAQEIPSPSMEEGQLEDIEEQPQGELELPIEDHNEAFEIPPEEIEEPEELVREEEPQEEEKDFIPEGVDPEVLAALPEDLRNEVLAQYRRPPAQSAQEGISEEFLAALPEDVRAEVIGQNQVPSQAEDIDAASFIASLPPELRQEVLLTASEEVLNSLPPEILAEARVLQERLGRRNMLPEWGQPRRKSPKEENKAIIEAASDEKLSTTLTPRDSSFIELLLKTFYMAHPVSKEIMSSLLLSICVQKANRQRVIDGLVSLLKQLESKPDFPQQHMIGSETLVENYSQVYATVSLRIIETLQFLATSMPVLTQEFTSVTLERLPLISELREDQSPPFKDLLSLLDQQIYKTSSSHLELLIKLIAALIETQEEVEAVDEFAIIHICSLLSFKSLNDATVNVLVQLVKNLAANDLNRQQIGKSLSVETELLANDISINVHTDDQAKLQLLRLCKVLKSVNCKAKLGSLWRPLTEALQQTEKLSSINKLFPIIEAFFISNAGEEVDPEFYDFCEDNKKILNSLVAQTPNLLNASFSALVTHFPQLLEFKNKKLYFQEEVKKMRHELGAHHIRLNIRRSRVFMDSYNQLKVRSPEEMLGKLRVQFAGEEGLDAGGLTREWYTLLAKEIFNPNYALFVPSANGASFQPNSLSAVNRDSHLLFFRFVGRFISKAVSDMNYLDVYFTRSFYKHIIGKEISIQDVEDLDPDFYNSIKKLEELNLGESDLHEYYFVYEEEEFGRVNVIDLVPDGRNVRVTEHNKQEYISALCHMKMTNNIQAQIEAFLSGFYEIIPKHIISIFDAKELELLISGLPTIDLEDMYENTEYHNYTRDSQVIKWLWEVLEEFNNEERAGFIQFVTGSSKVPLEGFKALPGMRGIERLQIHKSFVDTDRLPTAHTCMNQLDLPDYPSKEILKKLLKLAITEGKEGFGFV